MKKSFIIILFLLINFVHLTRAQLYTQNFAEGYLPLGWTESKGLLDVITTLSGSQSYWAQGDFGNIVSAGSECARLYIYDSGSSRNEWTFTPTVTIPVGDYRLVFDLALTPYDGNAPATLEVDDKFAVVISTDNGVTWSSSNVLQLWNSTTTISNTGQSIVIPLSGYSGDVKFGFYGETTTGISDNFIFIDNIVVEEVPTVPVLTINPSSKDFGPLQIYSSVSQVFNLSNTGAGSLVINSSADIVLSGINADMFEMASLPSFPITLSGAATVTLSVNYNPTVVGIHSANLDITDSNSEIHNVALTGEGYDFTIYPEYIQDFEGELFAPENWINANWVIGGTPYEGLKSAQTSYDHDGEAILQSPRIFLPGNYRISFFWKDNDSKKSLIDAKDFMPKVENHDTTFFEIMVEGTSNWVTLDFLSSPSSMSNYEQSVTDLSAYNGKGIYVRWRDKNDQSINSLGTVLDYISITEITDNNVGITELKPKYSFLNGTITPIAEVTNFGQNTATFDVELEITDGELYNYSETISVTNLIYSNSQVLSFADVILPILGDYTVTVKTLLTEDENTSNDSLITNYGVLDENNIAYAYSIYNETNLPSNCPVIFELSSPEDIYVIADHSADNYSPRGGEWLNNIWYAFDIDLTPAISVKRFIKINPVTGDKIVITDNVDYAPIDITYDYTTETMFGIVVSTGDIYALFSINLETGSLTQIGLIQDGIPLTLACNLNGELFSVFADGNFYNINKTNGSKNLVGNLGVTGLRYVQSMSFDHRNGDILYWNQQGTSSTGDLYTINVETGFASLVGQIYGNAELVSFAIPYTVPSNTYTVNFNVVGIEPNGTLIATVDSYQISTGSEVEEGSTVVFTATPSNGYKVKEWKENSIIVSDNNSNEFNILNLENNTEVTVEFEIINNINNINNANISIYPNPSDGLFKLTVDKQYFVDIIDVTGKVVLKAEINSVCNVIDLTSLNKGLYFIRLNDEKNITLQVILK
jgi:hypothetical protein